MEIIKDIKTVYRYKVIGLKEQREKAGLSLSQLANKLGISKSYVAKIETGERFLPEKLHNKLVEAFN